jgi:Phage gp6-like head-tail connector protein
MPITKLETVKAIKGYADTRNDERIKALIPLVEDWIKGYTGETFLDENDAPLYPSGYERIAINLIEYDLKKAAGIKSESLGSYSVSFEEDYPPSLIKGLRQKVRFF